jgi:iron complex outermembrane receptor protein
MPRPVRTAFLFLVMLLGPAGVFGQQDSTVEWRLSLQDLDRRLAVAASASAADLSAWRSDAEALRSSLAFFASTHPDMVVEIPPPLADTTSADALRRQLDRLTIAVDQIVKQSPGSPFHLGTVEVSVAAPGSSPSLVSDQIDRSEIEQHTFPTIAKAFDYLPGVEIQHIAANRNEAGIMVRGFATRGQVPFYLDGVPISVPYDGFVDFNRFLTSDLAKLQVDKGYSSPLLGPNALGGAINLVTNEPVKAVEGSALLGIGSGQAVPASASFGARWARFFVQGSADRLRVDNVPLSGDFQVRQYANLPDVTMTDRLNHSNALDTRYSGRIGWTPRAGDEYVFSATTQHGEKGVPLYQGPNTAAAFRNFWSWPYWDMKSFYVHSATRLDPFTTVKVRAFYNKFNNAIDMFSNDTYTVMNTANAERSAYAEHTDGASVEVSTLRISRHAISGSFFFKNDVHAETGTFPARSPFPLVTPTLEDSDQQISIGVQDAIAIGSRLSATVGFSADHFNGQQGESYNATLTAVVPFTCLSSPTNASVSGCTLHAWNSNPQASLSYQVSPSSNLFVTFADRGRFPMLKDIYSASLGAGLPNPDLRPERSRSWNVGYSQTLPRRTFAQIVAFRSDLRDAIESVSVVDPGGTNRATQVCPNGRIPGFCSQMVNIGQEVHDGVELKVRSTPVERLSVDASYSLLNRDISYDFSRIPTVSQVNTSIIILPTLPKHKLVGTASIRLPRDVMGMVSARYENGLVLQDTTYATTSPLFQPFSESFATMDLAALVPIQMGVKVQAGVKNVFDKNYYYTAGYPEAGRTWFVNLRWQF